jgi:hypothetical protein
VVVAEGFLGAGLAAVAAEHFNGAAKIAEIARLPELRIFAWPHLLRRFKPLFAELPWTANAIKQCNFKQGRVRLPIPSRSLRKRVSFRSAFIRANPR